MGCAGMMQRKPIFDAVRQMLGRSFRQTEVDTLDTAIEEARLDTRSPTRVGPAGIALVRQFEGCARVRRDGRVEAYPDPATSGAPWTIGWGSTGPDIGPGTEWSQSQCDARLEADLAHSAADVSRAIGPAPTSQNQFDALVCFQYNTGAIARATLTKKHVAGDYAGAAAEFARWNRAAGRIVAGLTRRRAAEAALYAAAEPPIPVSQ